MIRTITQNDVVDYIYQQNNKTAEVEIEKSKELHLLSKELHTMKETLDGLEFTPPQRAIDNILAYAKAQKKQS